MKQPELYGDKVQKCVPCIFADKFLLPLRQERNENYRLCLHARRGVSNGVPRRAWF
jgi:hypothetical protein